ncbi:MAG: SIMPL domain-containing protein [Puniceicoccales bacterium]|jgi:uncharacterized protein YggE|nr:SIMPL domain-containing protein [Puniceicoccales bacterium]
MKKLLLLLVTFTVLTALPLQAQHWRTSDTPVVSVSGNAEIKVVPDLIDIRLGIEVRDPSLEKAQAMHQAKMSAVIEALKAQGIPARDIHTDYVGMAPYSVDGKTGKSEYYFVQKSIACTIRDTSLFENALKAAIAAGATHVHGIDFKTSELRKHRDTARLNAIKAAKEKADLLTQALGAKTGKPISISENYWGGSWSWSSSFWGWRSSYSGTSQNISQSGSGGGQTDAAGSDIALGQISISATVNVSFLIE